MKLPLALALASCVCAGADAFAQTPPAAVSPVQPAVVVTHGEATIRMAPDRAFVTITAESRARTPREAQQGNARAMTAVQLKLKEAALPADAIRTLSYDLQPEFDYANGRQTLRGYVARNAIEVRLDEVARVGEVADLGVGAGATSVSGIRFDLKDRAATEREALKRAVADAQARAQAAAGGAGRSVLRVLRIEEEGTERLPPPRPMMQMAMRAEQDTVQTPISAGEIEIRARVTLTAELR